MCVYIPLTVVVLKETRSKKEQCAFIDGARMCMRMRDVSGKAADDWLVLNVQEEDKVTKFMATFTSSTYVPTHRF